MAAQGVSFRLAVELLLQELPATSEATFSPAFAPLSVATVNRSSVNVCSPAASDKPITGSSPADDTRFGSSKTTEVRVRV